MTLFIPLFPYISYPSPSHALDAIHREVTDIYATRAPLSLFKTPNTQVIKKERLADLQTISAAHLEEALNLVEADDIPKHMKAKRDINLMVKEGRTFDFVVRAVRRAYGYRESWTEREFVRALGRVQPKMSESQEANHYKAMTFGIFEESCRKGDMASALAAIKVLGSFNVNKAGLELRMEDIIARKSLIESKVLKVEAETEQVAIQTEAIKGALEGVKGAVIDPTEFFQKDS